MSKIAKNLPFFKAKNLSIFWKNGKFLDIFLTFKFQYSGDSAEENEQ